MNYFKKKYNIFPILCLFGVFASISSSILCASDDDDPPLVFPGDLPSRNDFPNGFNMSPADLADFQTVINFIQNNQSPDIKDDMSAKLLHYLNQLPRQDLEYLEQNAKAINPGSGFGLLYDIVNLGIKRGGLQEAPITNLNEFKDVGIRFNNLEEEVKYRAATNLITSAIGIPQLPADIPIFKNQKLNDAAVEKHFKQHMDHHENLLPQINTVLQAGRINPITQISDLPQAIDDHIEQINFEQFVTMANEACTVGDMRAVDGLKQAENAFKDYVGQGKDDIKNMAHAAGNIAQNATPVVQQQAVRILQNKELNTLLTNMVRHTITQETMRTARLGVALPYAPIAQQVTECAKGFEELGPQLTPEKQAETDKLNQEIKEFDAYFENMDKELKASEQKKDTENKEKSFLEKPICSIPLPKKTSQIEDATKTKKDTTSIQLDLYLKDLGTIGIWIGSWFNMNKFYNDVITARQQYVIDYLCNNHRFFDEVITSVTQEIVTLTQEYEALSAPKKPFFRYSKKKKAILDKLLTQVAQPFSHKRYPDFMKKLVVPFIKYKFIEIGLDYAEAQLLSDGLWNISPWIQSDTTETITVVDGKIIETSQKNIALQPLACQRYIKSMFKDLPVLEHHTKLESTAIDLGIILCSLWSIDRMYIDPWKQYVEKHFEQFSKLMVEYNKYPDLSNRELIERFVEEAFNPDAWLPLYGGRAFCSRYTFYKLCYVVFKVGRFAYPFVKRFIF